MLCCIPPGTNMSLRSRRSRLRWKFNRWRLGHRIVSQNTGSEASLQERQLRAPGTIGRVRNHEYLCRPVPIQLPPITANIEGFLVETMSFLPKQSWKKGPINVAAKDEIGRYESSRGTEVTFEIIPQAGRTYTQALEIWKGFDQGRRDLHFHLGNCLRCAVCRFSVDLTPYVRAGRTVTRKPELFVFPNDTGCSELCANRKRNNPVTPGKRRSLGRVVVGNPRFSRGRC